MVRISIFAIDYFKAEKKHGTGDVDWFVYDTLGSDGSITRDGFSFEDRNVKHGFIRKVYGLLTVQLTITVGIIMAIYIPTKDAETCDDNYFCTHTWPFWTCLAITLVMVIAMGCVPELRRKSPINLVCLFIFTAAEGVLVGIACSAYSAKTVAIAAGVCTGMVLLLTLFAFQTKIDFTMMTGILFVCVTILILFGFFAIIFSNEVLQVVYCALGVAVFSIYIVVDTQLMIGGGHQYKIDEEEYVFAALNLYLDIIQLFLFLLMLFGRSD